MESLSARRGYLSSRELKAQLESVILENAATSAARCAALCEAQVEAARREERRRALGGEALEQLEASNCGAWTRGFFDAKVENFGHPRPEDAESGKAKHQLHVTCHTQFGEMDCQRILTDAFSIRGRLSSILAESTRAEVQQPKAHRDLACDTDSIVKTTCKMLEKLHAADPGQPPGAQEALPSGSRRPSAPPPPPGHSRKTSHSAPAGPASSSSERRATDQPYSASQEAPAAASASQSSYRRATYQAQESASSRIGMLRQKTAQTLELGRMLEELTADLQTAHIISPSAERAGALLKSSGVAPAPGLQ